MSTHSKLPLIMYIFLLSANHQASTRFHWLSLPTVFWRYRFWQWYVSLCLVIIVARFLCAPQSRFPATNNWRRRDRSTWLFAYIVYICRPFVVVCIFPLTKILRTIASITDIVVVRESRNAHILGIYIFDIYTHQYTFRANRTCANSCIFMYLSFAMCLCGKYEWLFTWNKL
jgi:hypothetical protein